MAKQNKLMSGKMWLHWLTISAIIFGLLQLIFHGDMFSIKNVLISTPLIAFGDLASEFILGIIGVDVD